MNLLTIPLRNLRRKPLRSALLVLLFSLGLTSVVALAYISQQVGHNLEKKLLAYGANILVTPHTEKLTVSYGGFQLGDLAFGENQLDEETSRQNIASIELDERISAVAPKLVAPAQVRGTMTGLVGVDWEQEIAIKGFWSLDTSYQGGAFPNGQGQVLAGAHLAQTLGLAPGDSLEVLGHGFTVSGVLAETGSDDDKVLFLDLSELQDQTGQPGKVSFIEVAALCSGCPIDDIVSQLRQALPGSQVTALKNVVEQRMYSVRYVQTLVLGVSLVILVIACAMVGLAMLSSVNERKKEIGILRSLGYGRGDVFAVFCFEAVLMGALAGIIGYAAGLGTAEATLSVLDLAGEGGSSGLTLAAWQPAVTMVGAALMAGLSALAPAWKAARVRPWNVLSAL